MLAYVSFLSWFVYVYLLMNQTGDPRSFNEVKYFSHGPVSYAALRRFLKETARPDGFFIGMCARRIGRAVKKRLAAA
jgi:hypothetical protein